MFAQDFKPICQVVPPGLYKRAFMCFNINLKSPQGVLESSCKPLKLKQLFNSPISMKVNRACLLFSRLHNRTVALIHTVHGSSTVLHCWPLSSSEGAAEVLGSCSRAQLLLREDRCIHPGFTWTSNLDSA